MASTGFFPQCSRTIAKCFAALAAVLLFVSACAAQAPAAPQPPEESVAQYLKNHPGLADALMHLTIKLANDLKYPSDRSESRILPLLPESTISYAAFSNYGDVSHQALAIFHEELKESPALASWWREGEVGKAAPKIEESFDKFYEASQYLGPEIVLSAQMEGREPNFLIAVEARKPGLKKYLQQLMSQYMGSAKSPIRLLDPQDLAAAQKLSPPESFAVLVRPDFIVGATDIAALRSFNSRLDRPGASFTATPFGQRVARAYTGGATSVAAADMQAILAKIPRGSAKDQADFQRSGFSDMKYLVWDHKTVAERGLSEAELTFTGPRRGSAAWLANPGPMGSLDFASPASAMLLDVRLTNLAQIFEDVKELAGPADASSFAALAGFEHAFNLSLKDDLLSRLGGEIMAEFISATPPKPAWKIVLQATDPDHIEHALNALLEATHFPVEKSADGGLTSYTLHVPSGTKPVEITYAFVDGYWLITSGTETLAQAVRLHRSGESLAKSRRFLDALPAGHESGASALWFQDPLVTAALQLRAASPELAGYLDSLAGKSPPSVLSLYGDDTSIRESNRSGAFDVSAFVLVAAAVAIPNLLRAKTAANEASAVGSIRTLVTAQVTYSVTYPDKGFAPDLASLGPGPDEKPEESARHAGLVDATLGCESGAWCLHSGYRFNLTSVCQQHLCKDFAAVATPASANDGVRSFCATSDGVIRTKTADTLTAPITISECESWPPLQ
ncbi:MAG: hypothetical protein ACRD59_01010 [Candidatus Acidiferrales bacterium]